VYSRIVGYYRPVQNWNLGKKSEYHNRKLYKKGIAGAALSPQPAMIEKEMVCEPATAVS
jgi:ribonucleoside-triphosphate reductase